MYRNQSTVKNHIIFLLNSLLKYYNIYNIYIPLSIYTVKNHIIFLLNSLLKYYNIYNIYIPLSIYTVQKYYI